MSSIPAVYTNTNTGFIGGHYMVSQTSGAIAATPSSGDVVASVRWAPASGTGFMVLHRLKLGYLVATAITATVQAAFKCSITRGFTVDFTTNSTAINMSTVTKTNTMLSGTMANSQMGANGPRICTTAGMTGQTKTDDTAPFSIVGFPPVGAGQISTALQSEPGQGWFFTAYEWTSLAQHPIVLSPNEGVVVAWNNAGHASGTVNVYATWEWAEVATF